MQKWKWKILFGLDDCCLCNKYNTGHIKRFKIVAEGITSDGRMLMLEKIFDEIGKNNTN